MSIEGKNGLFCDLAEILERLEETLVREGDVTRCVIASFALAESREEHRRVWTSVDGLLHSEAVSNHYKEGFAQVALKKVIDDGAVAADGTCESVVHCRRR